MNTISKKKKSPSLNLLAERLIWTIKEKLYWYTCTTSTRTCTINTYLLGCVSGKESKQFQDSAPSFAPSSAYLSHPFNIFSWHPGVILILKYHILLTDIGKHSKNRPSKYISSRQQTLIALTAAEYRKFRESPAFSFELGISSDGFPRSCRWHEYIRYVRGITYAQIGLDLPDHPPVPLLVTIPKPGGFFFFFFSQLYRSLFCLIRIGDGRGLWIRNSTHEKMHVINKAISYHFMNINSWEISMK